MALFLRELFALLDRGVVLELASAYSDAITISPADHSARQSMKAYLRVEFLHVLADSEYHVQLLLPIKPPLEPKAAGVLVETQARNHAFAALLCRNVLLTLRQLRTEPARRAAVAVLLTALTKLDSDRRYNRTAARVRIASCYLVLPLLLVEQWAELADWRTTAPADERRELYTAVAHVLSYVERSLLTAWLARTPGSQATAFAAMLQDAVVAFECTPSDAAAPPYPAHIALQALLDAAAPRAAAHAQAQAARSALVAAQPHQALSQEQLDQQLDQQLQQQPPAEDDDTQTNGSAPSGSADSTATTTTSSSSSSSSAVSLMSGALSPRRKNSKSRPGRPSPLLGGASARRAAASTLTHRHSSSSLTTAPAAAVGALDDIGLRRTPGIGNAPSGGSKRLGARSDAGRQAVALRRNSTFEALRVVLESSELLVEHRRFDHAALTAAYRLLLRVVAAPLPELFACNAFRALRHFLVAHGELFFHASSAALCHEWAVAFVRYCSG
jgi:hypothetical protein